MNDLNKSKVNKKNKPVPVDRKKLRDYLLHSKGFMNPTFTALEELRQAKHYIITMEEFIASSELAEVTELEKQTESMTKDEKDEFWQWNAPIHWEEIFGVRIRSSFCIQLCSQVESTLEQIAKNVNIIAECPITVKNIQAQNTLSKYRLYNESFGKFKSPSESMWKEMGFLFNIRNIYVHEQGYLGDMNKNIEFMTFLKKLPNISIRGDFIDLKANSCQHLLDISVRFHNELFAEYDKYKKEIISLEP